MFYKERYIFFNTALNVALFDCKTMFIIIYSYYKCMHNIVIIKDGLDLLYENTRSVIHIYTFSHI